MVFSSRTRSRKNFGRPPRHAHILRTWPETTAPFYTEMQRLSQSDPSGAEFALVWDRNEPVVLRRFATSPDRLRGPDPIVARHDREARARARDPVGRRRADPRRRRGRAHPRDRPRRDPGPDGIAH